jgi:hypothetical protein
MSHSDETLCSTCSRSTITRGRSLDEEIIDCHIFGVGPRRITFRVTSCSAYADARLPTMMQLMTNAWVLRGGTKRRPAGFIHGRDLRSEELATLMAEADLAAADDDGE